jgi:hypothetical protein
MKIGSMLVAAGLLVLVGCGGSSSSSSGTPPINAFTGTLTITSALPMGTTACSATQTVTFTAAGASVHTVTAAGGDCLTFMNSDTASHRPASNGPGCPELDAASSLTQGQSFTTPPLAGPKTCYWEDALNPPSSGGAGY